MSKNGTIKYKKADGTVEELLPKTSAANVSLTSISGMSATNAQSAFEELNDAIKNAGGGSSGVTVTAIDVELVDGDALDVTASGKTVDATLAVSFSGDNENIDLSFIFGGTTQSYSVSDYGCAVKISTYKNSLYGAIVEITDFLPLGNVTKAFHFRNNTPAIFQIQASSDSGTCYFYVQGRTITYA